MNKKNNKNETCTICQSSALYYDSVDKAKLYRCLSCGHCFSRAEVESVEEIYGSEYYEDTHKNWFENPNVKLFEKVEKIIFDNFESPTVIDIGCGKGDFLKYLNKKDKPIELTGIDFTDNDDIEGIEFLKGDILNLELVEKYDVVTNFAVIEHIEDSVNFIDKLKSACKEDGLVIIMTLDESSLLYAIARILKSLGYRKPFERLYSVHHVNHFSKKSLRKLTESQGLETVKIISHNMPLKAIDIPEGSFLGSLIQKIAVIGIFFFGKLINRTYLQTIVSRNKSN